MFYMVDDNSSRPVGQAGRVIGNMALFIWFLCVVITTVAATSPVLNETNDSIVPISKPVISVPRKCPTNEVLKARTACPPDTCDSLYLSFLCIANQTEEVVCTCKDGYLRTNSTGVCVPVDRCLPPECANDPNAQRGCGNRCKKTCADYNDTNKVCNNNGCHLYGCECKDGFVYDDNIEKCVKPKQCSKQCTKPHERYSRCLLGECRPKTCDDVGKPIACPGIASPCAGGCICEEGFVRNSNGDCVDQMTCPKRCPKPHERYTNCLLGECRPKACDDLGKPVPCPSIASPCAGGCACEEGFVRNSNGTCVDQKTCPSCGGDPNAVSGCSNYCGKTCASLHANKSAIACPDFCEYNGCDCKKGYLYNSDTKKCVLERECPKPPQQCGQNEEYYCGTSCPEPSCNTPNPPICINKRCKLACFCKKGFVRDANNKCVAVNKCPSCRGPHEVYSSCPAGQCQPKTCDNLIHPAPCPRVIPPCPGGCICKEDYLRNSNGICIEKNNCPQACNANQTYVSCSVKCPDRYCPENDQPQPVCDPPRNCPPGCACKINYKLDKNDNCILASECPPVNCTRQNEVWDSCPSDCLAENCKDADTPPAVCNTLLFNCQPKCVCKSGYYRNKDGLYIPARECYYANCGANETFVPCTFRCPQVMCPESDLTLLCKPPRDCPGGCGCKPNYKYNSTGDCILGSECPPVECTRPNEEWAACRSAYDYERCEDRYNTPPIISQPGDDECNPRCTCSKGYYKNDNNECVPEKDCPSIGS